MTFVQELAKQAAVAISDDPAGLSDIHRPGCAAAIWRRDPLPAFQSWIDGLAPERLPKARMILRPYKAREATAHICQLCEMPDCVERTMLIDDAAAMADIFAEVMAAEFLRLRFVVVTTNACRKFHVDAITARLICTYRGTGTQYGVATDGEEPQRIATVQTGAPILLRGKVWPTRPSAGLVHRSPPIERAGETRLVLVLDTVSDPDDYPEPKLIH